MKKYKNVLISTLTLLFMVVFSVFLAHLWQYNHVLRADQRIVFIKLLEKEHVSDNLLDFLYQQTKDDYCKLNEGKNSFIFGYTLNTQFTFLSNEIETLFDTVLKSQHGKNKGKCV